MQTQNKHMSCPVYFAKIYCQLKALVKANMNIEHAVAAAPGGGALVFQAGYHSCKKTFKTHPKHVFSGMKIDPKYAFLDGGTQIFWWVRAAWVFKIRKIRVYRI